MLGIKKILAVMLAVMMTFVLMPYSSVIVGASDVLYGDADSDGTIGLKDLLTIKKYSVGIKVNCDIVAADVNSDGAVDIKDMLMIKKYMVGIIDSLGDSNGASDNLGGGGEVVEKPDVEDTSEIIKDIDGIDYSNSDVDTTESWDSESCTNIVLSDSEIKVNGSGATLSGKVVNITSAGTYVVSGTSKDAQIYINVDGNVYLILNGVDITCKDSAPIVIMGKKKKVVTVAAGTENKVTDASSYSVFYNTDNDEPNGAIFSKKALTINGTGKLTMNGNYNNGISCKDVLRILNADITVSAINNAVKGNDAVILRDCKVTASSQDTGIKSDATDEGTGFVYFENSNATVNSLGDGIQAVSHVYMVSGSCTIKTGTNGSQSTYPSSDALSRKGIKCDNYLYIKSGTITVDSYDDAIHCNDSVVVEGGTLDLKTADDAIHADEVVEISGGAVTASKCYEGIEAAKITISGGNVSITSSDDGINASDGSADSGPNIGPGGGYVGGNTSNVYFVMTDGTLYVNAQGDGLDSNGTITISGGTITVDGPTGNGNGALDSNNGILVNGGNLIAAGSRGMVETPGTNSQQCSVSVTYTSTLAAGSKIELRDESGNVILSHTSAKTCQSIIFSSEKIKKGSNYSVYINGSLFRSFAQTSTVTPVGASNGGFGGRG